MTNKMNEIILPSIFFINNKINNYFLKLPPIFHLPYISNTPQSSTVPLRNQLTEDSKGLFWHVQCIFCFPVWRAWEVIHTTHIITTAFIVFVISLFRASAVGSISKLKDSYYTFSVLEPKEKGGCKKKYFSVQRSTVQQTAK